MEIAIPLLDLLPDAILTGLVHSGWWLVGCHLVVLLLSRKTVCVVLLVLCLSAAVLVMPYSEDEKRVFDVNPEIDVSLLVVRQDVLMLMLMLVLV